MLPILQVGPFALRTPGLALLAALWIGLEVSSREGARRGIDGDRIYNLGFYALVAGVLGARLGFVLLHLRLYTGITPWTRLLGAVFTLTPGTETPWIGLVLAAGVVAYLIWRWGLPPLVVTDSFAPGLAILAVGVGLANFLSGKAYYGIETTLPWGISMGGITRHPTQLYFALGSLATFAVLWRLRYPAPPSGKRSGGAKKRAASYPYPPGFAAQVLVILLCLTILLVEPLRADSPTLPGGVRVWEVIALLGLVAGLAGFVYRPPVSSKAA